MGRQRKGVHLKDGRFHAGLPVAVGAKKQRTMTDADEAAVTRWYTDAEQALDAGRPLPDPAAYRAPTTTPSAALPDLGSRTPPTWWNGSSAAHGHRLDTVAADFLVHRFDLQRSGQFERQKAVADVIDNDLLPFFTRSGVILIEHISHQLVAQLAAELAGITTTAGVAVTPWPELTGRYEVTLAEAAALPGASRSGLKRWRDQERLPSWRIDPVDGKVRVQVTELQAARQQQRTLMPSPTRPGIGATTSGNKLNVLKMVLDFAKASGIVLTGDPMASIRAVAPDSASHRKGTEKVKIPLSMFGDVARNLPVVHQVTMWLERVLGCRIGEGFGPKVGDFIDFGGNRGACLVIERQGGRTFRQRIDGEVVQTSSKERLKSPESDRTIRLPRQLVDMIRVLIAAFHTDPDTGEVDFEARLVPGLRNNNTAGQAAYRTALGKAVAEAGINDATYGRITPKTLRACLVTDLSHVSIPDMLAHRYVGHAAGKTVHARDYFLDPARSERDLQEWRPVTDRLEGLIDTELGGSLMIPTSERETFGKNNPLRARLHHIYATLAAAGWYVEPADDSGEALLTTVEVAKALDVTPQTARRWLREGRLPGVSVTTGRSIGWMCSAAAVQQHVEWLRANPTIEDLASELGMTYHELYELMAKVSVEGVQTKRGGDIRLTVTDAARLVEERDRRQGLAARAVPLSIAATELGVPVLVIETLLRQGVLVLDQEASQPRERHITRASLQQHTASRSTSATAAPDEPVVTDLMARQITGLSRPGLAHLVLAGVLVSTSVNRRRCITTASIEQWVRQVGVSKA